MASTPGKLDGGERELHIVKYLKKLSDPESGATVRDIWEAVTTGTADEVTVNAYHKILDKMQAQHKVELVDAPGADGVPKKYRIAEYLMPENALTLDDLYENLWSLAPPEAVARYMDAIDYFDERRDTTLRKAAEALREEEPVALVSRMILHKVDVLNKCLAMWGEQGLQDAALKNNIVQKHLELLRFVTYGLGISYSVVNLRTVDELLEAPAEVIIDKAGLEEAVRRRVVGTTFLFEVDASTFRKSPEHSRLLVSGSDGSLHASILAGATAPAFVDEFGRQVVTFNNSLAFIDAERVTGTRTPYPFHGVPMSRSAIEDPGNKGMILAPFMYSDLNPSEFEHLKKCALDVVQFRVDEKMIGGKARSLGKGSALLPRPTVHIRDGTVTPQEREFQHYARTDAYGDMVKEGIKLSLAILEQIVAAKKPLVFAGAVKATQLSLFSQVLNWYIASGSQQRFGKPLDPTWNLSTASHITDNVAMSRLLSPLAPAKKTGRYLCTCAIVRPFPALVTDLRQRYYGDGQWVDYFRKRQDKDHAFWKETGGPRPYLDTVGIEDEPYVRMCEEADYVMFYIGHSGGDPAPFIPRYEFLDSLRKRPLAEAVERVSEKVRRLVEAIDVTGLSLDRDHNLYTNKKLVKVIPFVVYNAHEHGKELGAKLEAELKSVVIARLYEMKKARGLSPKGIALVPVSIRAYIERMREATDADQGVHPQDSAQ